MLFFCGRPPIGPIGTPEAVSLTKKALAALGGEEGIRKRRNLYIEQEVRQPIPGGGELKISVQLWQKGDKRRMEQRIGSAPGAPVVVIYDGKDLFLLVNGERRDPGIVMKKAFEAGREREDLWWDCLRKRMRVSYLGEQKINNKKLLVLVFTHFEEDTTKVGLDPKTFLPCYMEWKAPDPYTGKLVKWVQWQKDFKKVPEAGGLYFPFTVEVQRGEQKIWTAVLKKVRYEPSLPDSLFGAEKPVN